MPIVDCLKLPDVDAVNACIDSLSPWLQIDADSGDVPTVVHLPPLRLDDEEQSGMLHGHE